MNRFLIIAATVAVLVIASTSSPACIETPAQWSGHIYEVSIIELLIMTFFCKDIITECIEKIYSQL